jgi:hypothetical protein
MTKRRKAILVFAVVLLATLISVVFGLTYWSRTVSKNITVIGIEAILTNNNYDAYRLKQETATLDSTNKVVISVLAENYYNLWLNITWDSDAIGLVVTAQGQFVNVHWVGPDYGVIETFGSAFNVMGYSSYNETTKLNLMWANPGTSAGGPTGHGLLVTFAFDTEAVTTPGDYSVNFLFEMGFV